MEGFRIIQGEDASNFYGESRQLLEQFLKETEPVRSERRDQFIFDEHQEAIEQGHAVLAQNLATNQLVGQLLFTVFNKPPAGKPYCGLIHYPAKELHRGFVLPEFRGSRIYTREIRPATIALAEQLPGTIITATVNPAVAEMCIKTGFVELQNEELWRIYGYDPEKPELCPPEMGLELENYRCFILPHPQSITRRSHP